MTITAGIGGIQGSSAPSAPLNVIAVGGVEQATVTWTVPDPGASGIVSFTITPILAGEVPLTPVIVPIGLYGSTLDPTPGQTDQYTFTGILIGEYSFTVAATNASVTGPVGTSNLVNVLAPPVAISTPSRIPHLALPLVIGPNGSFSAWQQDTLDEVAQCVEVILGTPRGSRAQVPGFGVPAVLFTESGPSAQALAAACQTWEPRANVVISVTQAVGGDVGSAAVNAAVTLKQRA